MENISSVLQLPHSSSVYSHQKLASLCQWIVHTHHEQLQQLCAGGPRNLTQYEYADQPDTRFVSHKYSSLYGDAIENSFTAGSGIIGTLGCVLLVLVVIAFISCIREHKRIQLLQGPRLSNIQLASLATTHTHSSSGRDSGDAEDCTEAHIDDNPPEYNTIISIHYEEESPPSYTEAVENHKVSQ